MGKQIEILKISKTLSRRYIFLITIFLHTTWICAAQDSLSEIAQRVKPSVVTIIAVSKDQTKAESGTGFFVIPVSKVNAMPTETTAKFARRIRMKYDAYFDKSDVDLVRRMLNRYPEYRKNVVFSFPVDDSSPKIVSQIPYPNEGSFVITNWHVVKDAKSIKIRTYDKKVFDVASVLAFSESGDIALLAIADKTIKYSPLEFSDSYPEQGDHVIVMGTPLGVLEGSLSTGIVSAVRDLPGFG